MGGFTCLRLRAGLGCHFWRWALCLRLRQLLLLRQALCIMGACLHLLLSQAIMSIASARWWVRELPKPWPRRPRPREPAVPDPRPDHGGAAGGGTAALPCPVPHGGPGPAGVCAAPGRDGLMPGQGGRGATGLELAGNGCLYF